MKINLKNTILALAAFAMVGGVTAAGVLGGQRSVVETKAEDEVFYTLAPAAGTNNSYTGNCDVTIGGIKWNVAGNSQMIPWRLGGKSLSNVERTVYSKGVLSEDVSKVELTVGGASSITVNSLQLIVDNDATFESPVSTVTKSFKANSTITFERPEAVSWKNCYFKFSFTVTVTVTSNKFVEFSEAKFYAASEDVGPENPISGISAVTLSKSSAPLNYSGALTATATFAPVDTDEAICWSSSDETVATIAPTEVNGTATITLVGEGTCVFTAANTDGSISCDSTTFHVEPAELKATYDVTFEGTGTDSDATSALTAAQLKSKMLGDGSLLTVSDTANVYNGKQHTLKFSSSKNNGSMTFSAEGNDIKAVVLEAQAYGADEASLSVKVGSNSAQSSGNLTADFKFYVFNFSTAGENVVITAANRLYIRTLALVVDGYSANQGAYNYSVSLLNGTAAGCKSLDSSALATAWGTLSSSFANLDTNYEGARAFFTGAESDENGTVLGMAAARYDYIVGKYLKAQGIETFADFASRDPAAVAAASTVSLGQLGADSIIPVVITIIALGALATGGMIFLSRKRKRA